ncbi:MAG: ferritin-like domain-containing protein [Acidobacteriaceae bacterium]
MSTNTDVLVRQKAPLNTPSDLSPEAVKDITGALNALLADVFSLYLKTKNFHWHMSGPHFRDYHLLLDNHGDQIFAMTDDIAFLFRKIMPKTRMNRFAGKEVAIVQICTSPESPTRLRFRMTGGNAVEKRGWDSRG